MRLQSWSWWSVLCWPSLLLCSTRKFVSMIVLSASQFLDQSCVGMASRVARKHPFPKILFCGWSSGCLCWHVIMFCVMKWLLASASCDHCVWRTHLLAAWQCGRVLSFFNESWFQGSLLDVVDETWWDGSAELPFATTGPSSLTGLCVAFPNLCTQLCPGHMWVSFFVDQSSRPCKHPSGINTTSKTRTFFSKNDSGNKAGSKWFNLFENSKGCEGLLWPDPYDLQS